MFIIMGVMLVVSCKERFDDNEIPVLFLLSSYYIVFCLQVMEVRIKRVQNLLYFVDIFFLLILAG